MKCPHCLVAIHFGPSPIHVIDDAEEKWYMHQQTCPACLKKIIFLHRRYFVKAQNQFLTEDKFLVFPKRVARAACPKEVPDEYADDYQEAVTVLGDSPKASAALSRRCLQHILREKGGATQRDLADQIDYVMANAHLPSHISDSIDAVRNVGNFAAHPLKSKASGEIVEVEPGEAEWNLQVLESLFDYYFVQPAKVKAARDALNKKLVEAGKPAMK